jgi:hypothetical protein
VQRRKVVWLALAFVMTALLAFALGLWFAKKDGAEPSAPSSGTPSLVDAGPKLMLDPSKVKLLPDAELHLGPPPVAPRPASSP